VSAPVSESVPVSVPVPAAHNSASVPGVASNPAASSSSLFPVGPCLGQAMLKGGESLGERAASLLMPHDDTAAMDGGSDSDTASDAGDMSDDSL